jgi:hypothetical protein
MKVATLLLAVCSTVQAEPWTETQQALATTYMVAHTIDWAQTRNIARNPLFEERNPFLDRKPSNSQVNAHFILTPIVGYFILDALPSGYRTTALTVLNVIEVGVVGHNFSIGIKARW